MVAGYCDPFGILLLSSSYLQSPTSTLERRILSPPGSCRDLSQKQWHGYRVAALSSSSPASEMSSSAAGLKSVDYEIFGEVQGVFFRKYTEEQARKLGLVGWVKNTSQGTVIGQVQGAVEKVNFMMNWLKSVGSPMSRIDRANFSNEREISKLDFDMFSTRY
ncbi:acylphosphatase-2-like isoform X2 [Scyliorhinus canicula]|uniref:acylphosphatase-2-like isoform X2 n=1 Tax=Scyliorhinus canicula TaxID=7830 RepID=UPI0018F791ED|nr:acylphosphatase-2-like isoform X2 [Scyliorhinus canicula]